MGHHKSHNRASKGGTPEALSNHLKDKHDTQECGSKTGVRTRREKRSHKRKRDDTSKRRHKERRRGSHGSSRSSSKGKPREKVYRWKDSESSDSDNSSGLLSSKVGQRDSSSHHRGADVIQKRARSPSTIPHKENHKEHRSKRVKSDKENFRRDDSRDDDSRENCDSLIKPSNIEEEVHKRVDSDLGKVRKYMGAVSSSKGARSERDETVMKGQEQEMVGRKGNVLEVELRQKALANFMRHQDVLWRTDPQGPMSDDDTRQLAAYNERGVQGLGEVGNTVGDAINVDAPGCPCTHDTVLPIDVKCLAEENDNNLEEGEIKSDNETENENSSSVVNKVSHENLEGNPHAIRDDFEKQDDSRITSVREIERAGVSVAASCVNEKQELSEGQAVKDSPGVHQASSQRDSSNNFQEKTMSVMRGGEVVQVSYKVYIPKRAAELARRRLQR